MSTQSRPRSTSRARSQSPLSRPITPLRPSSRSSFRASQTSQPGGSTKVTSISNLSSAANPLDALEPQFAELSDSMADLEANFMHLQLMHESLARFGESFASFLYGLNMNAFVVDFPEQPLKESIQRYASRSGGGGYGRGGGKGGFGDESTIMPDRTKATTTLTDADSTLLSDTTFASLKATPARRRTTGGPPQHQQQQNVKTPATARTAAGMGASKKPAPAGAGGGGSGIPARTASTRGRGRGGAGAGARGSSGLPTRGRGRVAGRG